MTGWAGPSVIEKVWSVSPRSLSVAGAAALLALRSALASADAFPLAFPAPATRVG